MNDTITDYIWEAFCIILFSVGVVFVYGLFSGAYRGTDTVSRAGKARYALSEDVNMEAPDTGKLTASKVYFDIRANGADVETVIINDLGTTRVTDAMFDRNEQYSDGLANLIFETEKVAEGGVVKEIRYKDTETMYRMEKEMNSTGDVVRIIYRKEV